MQISHSLPLGMQLSTTFLPTGFFFRLPAEHLPGGKHSGMLRTMDKYERRRLRLLDLRNTLCDHNSAELARKIGREASYVTRMLYPEGKSGKKRIGDDMMEIIEKAFGLPRGWMDNTELVSAAAPVANDHSELLACWDWLLPSEKSETIERIRPIAARNREAAEQFGQAKVIRVVDRRKRQVHFGGPDHRQKKEDSHDG